MRSSTFFTLTKIYFFALFYLTDADPSKPGTYNIYSNSILPIFIRFVHLKKSISIVNKTKSIRRIVFIQRMLWNIVNQKEGKRFHLACHLIKTDVAAILDLPVVV